MLFGQIAPDQYAHFIGEDFFTFIIDNAAAVAIAVKGKTDIGTGFQNLVAHGVQHFHIFRIGVVMWEAVVQLAMQFDHLNAQRAQHIRGERPRRAIAASDNRFQFAFEIIAPRQIILIGLRHTIDALISAAVAAHASIFQHHIPQGTHFIRAERQRPRRAHFHAGPAIFIMARRHHSHSRCIKVKLPEISGRRQSKANIQNFHPGCHQAGDQSDFDALRIGAEIMADNNTRLRAITQ